jgi:CTP synthase
MKPWMNFLDRMNRAEKTVTIGLVGKYVELQDAYKSINEALFQAATYNDHRLKLVSIHSEKVNDANVAELLKDMDGVIVAPGFGNRGIEGKFVALRYCRENDIPTFGICLGMQCMVIEFGRHVLGLEHANSTEMDPNTPDNVIDLMEEQCVWAPMNVCSAKALRPLKPMAQPWSKSATATALSSTTTIANNMNKPE